MFDLFIIGMISYRVLVLVKVGNTRIFILPGAIVGGFLVTFQDRYFLFDTVIVLKQKAQKLSQSKEVFFFWSLHHTKLEKVFQPKVDKTA